VRDVEPPSEIGRGQVHYFALVDDEVKPTGATQHEYGYVVEGEIVPGPPMPPFAALAIVTYDNDNDYYLLYLDSNWEEVTDTCHESVERAKHQAEFEYEGITSKWVSVSPR
jgi:hypothetical protein